jgi:uncharacterized peroxidase-related enzyme
LTRMPSLGDEGVLPDVFRRFPETAAPLLDYCQRLMRGPSPLSVAQRELIAAFVSALNCCEYCQKVHSALAVAFGVDEGLVATVIADVDAAPVEEAMKPVLRLVRTLTLTPAQVHDAEVAEVYAAGWDEQTLHDAVSVCGLLNFMNRMVEGLGITASPDYYQTASRQLGGGAGYTGAR